MNIQEKIQENWNKHKKIALFGLLAETETGMLIAPSEDNHEKCCYKGGWKDALVDVRKVIEEQPHCHAGCIRLDELLAKLAEEKDGKTN